jgi:hypothetical protein
MPQNTFFLCLKSCIAPPKFQSFIMPHHWKLSIEISSTLHPNNKTILCHITCLLEGVKMAMAKLKKRTVTKSSSLSMCRKLISTRTQNLKLFSHRQHISFISTSFLFTPWYLRSMFYNTHTHSYTLNIGSKVYTPKQHW